MKNRIRAGVLSAALAAGGVLSGCGVVGGGESREAESTSTTAGETLSFQPPRTKARIEGDGVEAHLEGLTASQEELKGGAADGFNDAMGWTDTGVTLDDNGRVFVDPKVIPPQGESVTCDEKFMGEPAPGEVVESLPSGAKIYRDGETGEATQSCIPGAAIYDDAAREAYNQAVVTPTIPENVKTALTQVSVPKGTASTPPRVSGNRQSSVGMA